MPSISGIFDNCRVQAQSVDFLYIPDSYKIFNCTQVLKWELCTTPVFAQFWSLRGACEPLAASKAWLDVAILWIINMFWDCFARAAQALAPRVARNDNAGVLQRSLYKSAWSPMLRQCRNEMHTGYQRAGFSGKAPFYSNKSECVPVRMRQSSLPSMR